MKYIQKIDERSLYGDGIGKICLWDFSRANQNEESRIEAVSTVASICYGKPPKDAKKLVERLWVESGGLPSSAFEFLRSGDKPSIEESLRNNPSLPHDGEGRIGLTPDDLAHLHSERIATFYIKAPIFVARQVMRHRSMSFQELSRRYTTDKWIPLEFWEPQDDTDIIYENVYVHATTNYRRLIAAGVRAEIARAVLPVSLYTQFWLMSDAPGLKNYFKLRLDKHVQKEHRELAEAMLDLLKEHQPELWEKVKP